MMLGLACLHGGCVKGNTDGVSAKVRALFLLQHASLQHVCSADIGAHCLEHVAKHPHACMQHMEHNSCGMR